MGRAEGAGLELFGVIIDITADQFGTGMPPVFEGRVRRFHDLFEVQSRSGSMVETAIEQVNYTALEMYLLQRV